MHVFASLLRPPVCLCEYLHMRISIPTFVFLPPSLSFTQVRHNAQHELADPVYIRGRHLRSGHLFRHPR